MTKKQRSEKTRLMRLERNRRAAAVSRERKKRYISSLEDRSLIMSKHLEALELENRQLRKLLSQYGIPEQNLYDNVIPSLPNLTPSTFNEATFPSSRGNWEPTLTSVDEQNISERRNTTRGSQSALKTDDGLVNYNRGTKRRRVENKIPKKKDIW